MWIKHNVSMLKKIESHELTSEEREREAELFTKAIAQANEDIKLGVGIKTYEDEKRKGFRWCAIKDYPPIPCGGLHVKNAKETGEIALIGKETEKIIIAVK